MTQNEKLTGKDIIAVIILMIVVIGTLCIGLIPGIINKPVKTTISEESTYEEQVEAMQKINFIDAVSHIDAYEETKRSEDIHHSYSYTSTFDFENFQEPSINSYTFTCYYDYADYDGLCIFNKAKEYTLVKFDTYYQVTIKEYPVNAQHEKINDSYYEDFIQLAFFNGELQLTNEQ